MYEILKKIGIPATVAAVIASLVVTVPFLFQLDERYAKSDEVKTEIEKTGKAINEIAVELGKVSGTQATIVQLMAQQNNNQLNRRERLVERPIATLEEPTPGADTPAAPVSSNTAAARTTPRAVIAAPAQTSSALAEQKSKLDEVSRTIKLQQDRLQQFDYRK